MKKNLLLTPFLLLASACSENQEELWERLGCGKENVSEIWSEGPSETETAHAIVGGQRLTGSSLLAKRVVYIFVESESQISSCSGSLISDDVVLTARHCFEGRNPQSIKVSFGIDAPCETMKGQGLSRDVNLTDIRLLPPAPTLELGSDLALIRMSSSAPEGFEPVQISYMQFPGKLQNMYAAGFGRITDMAEKAYAGYLKILHFVLNKDAPKDARILNFSGLILINHKDFQSQVVCQGDSGGPLFQLNQGRLEQIGVSVLAGYADTPTCLGRIGFASLKDNHTELSKLFSELAPGEENPFEKAFKEASPSEVPLGLR